MDYCLAQAARALRRASPIDFEDVPIYLVPRRDLDERFDAASAGARGCTSPTLDLVLQSHLEDCGEWQGRGFTAIIDDGRIPFFDFADRELRVLAVVLHEACHRFQFDRSIAMDEPDPGVSRIRRAVLESEIPLFNLLAVDAAKQAPPWHGHAGDFVRLAIHMAHRAGVPAEWLWRHDSYDLSPMQTYVELLGDEPSRRCEESLFDIAGSSAPKKFEWWSRVDVEEAKKRLRLNVNG